VRRGWLKGVEAEILGEEGGMGGPRGLRPVISGRRGHCAEEGDDLQVGQGSQPGCSAARRGAGGWGQARSEPRRYGSVRRVRGERATLGRAGSGRGEGLGWWASGMGFGLGQVCFLLFPSSFLFLKQTKPNYLNPNSNLNSNLSTQTNKRDAPA